MDSVLGTELAPVVLVASCPHSDRQIADQRTALLREEEGGEPQ